MSEPFQPPTSTRAERTAPPSRRRLAIQVVAVVAVAVAIALLLTLCARAPHRGGGPGGPGGPAGARGGAGGHRGGRGGGGGAGGRPPVTVGIAKAATGSIPIQLSALGTVTPLATVNVNARVSGQLDVVAFREGQLVRRGQLLAQIDPRPFQVVVSQAEGQLARDLALLQNARVDLGRYRTLRSEDSIAGQQVDTQAALVKQDEGIVMSDRAAVASARLNLSFARIVSPVSGRVGLRQIDPGNQITANSATPIAVVTQIDPISVVFALPEQAIPGVAARGEAGLPVTAYDRAGGTALATGSLSTLDNVIDTTTGTVKAKARFANPSGALYPNQFVNVTLLVNTLGDQVVVPTTAVRHGPQGDYVWVLQPDNTVRARNVTVGPGTAETVSIAKGLSAGETVITEGGDRLRDGGAVVLPGQGPGAGGAAGPSGWRGRHGGRHRHGGGSGGDGAPSGG
ncbi:MAG: MdtA/MuxA family multidrug efflux RND transporter periplasmic adaptor subunit [Caulobacteraceae bacterium]|nr:MdtA/MuxA family multidrug efflux RND transporter periplasmic adaptor subunit [Caulobacteraceae bacterium]